REEIEMSDKNTEIYEVIKEHLVGRGIDAGQVTMEADLAKNVGLDSLDVIKFVLLVEERFGITIADEEIDAKELLKVDNLAGYVAERAA
ncbi:MAG: phosphopantetheine-binding protein, partial [Burkholderiales bacterium]